MEQNKLLLPIEIIRDSKTGIENASFSLSIGSLIVKERNLTRSKSINAMNDPNYYIIAGEEIIITINEKEYPNIKRTII